VLAELREVTGPDAAILLGFDRGGSYPVAFRACRDAGVDWLTYRRGRLAKITAAPRRSETVRAGRRVRLRLDIRHSEIAVVRGVCERYVLTQLPRCYVDLARQASPRALCRPLRPVPKGGGSVPG
jgi:hypothetical protein